MSAYDDNPNVVGSFVWIMADDTAGRRSRASQIGAARRAYEQAHGVELRLLARSYDETPGFRHGLSIYVSLQDSFAHCRGPRRKAIHQPVREHPPRSTLVDVVDRRYQLRLAIKTTRHPRQYVPMKIMAMNDVGPEAAQEGERPE